MKIAGFLKCRNEVVRGNLSRALANLAAVCDGGIVCDDASTDGTAEELLAFVQAHGPTWTFMRVHPELQAFDRELVVKQQMIELFAAEHAEDLPAWIWWLDTDETLDAKGTAELRGWVDGYDNSAAGVRFHYTQLWRNGSWARTDDGFDDGYFLKLWRWQPGLSFDLRPGTHRQQFPTQIDYGKCPVAPFEIIHWGNYGKALQFKAHQYNDKGLGGVDRHLAFGHTPEESLATGEGYDKPEWSKPNPTYRRVSPDMLPAAVLSEVRSQSEAEPSPFTMDEIRRIRSMRNLRGLQGWFTVVIPAFNRADTLPKALESLLAQRYEKWLAVVLDDGSTDRTPTLMADWQERDPRIFYCRYEQNRGGVAMNELGMAMACEMTEFWSRLGSDDWWGPGKLESDFAGFGPFEGSSVDAVFGAFTVWRHGKPAEICAGSWGASQGLSPSERLRQGQFLASWANVAVRTSVLRKVRERWGNFCDPSLRNMEDFLVNARIARIAEWVWRPGDPSDAWWNCLEAVGADPSASASANAEVTARDNAITQKLIESMRGMP
jgi:glycosyltransferase involved in cell wall biosynthesis